MEEGLELAVEAKKGTLSKASFGRPIGPKVWPFKVILVAPALEVESKISWLAVKVLESPELKVKICWGWPSMEKPKATG